MSPLERLRHDGVLTLTSLIEDIAGEPVRGTWWSHPAGKQIYAAGEALDASEEVLATKLVDGRVTWVHKALWPFLARVVGDPAWRVAAIATLDLEARALLAEIEAKGEVRKPPKKPREALERRLLCDAESVHEGHHVMVLRPWRFSVAPADCSLDEALGRIREACGGRRSGLD